MKLKINSNSINHDTGKASLISIPKTDKAFWLSNKCCYPQGRFCTIYLNEDYTYIVTKKKGKLTSEINGEDLLDYFEEYRIYDKQRPDVITYEHIPNYVEPEREIRVDSELLRGEDDG